MRKRCLEVIQSDPLLDIYWYWDCEEKGESALYRAEVVDCEWCRRAFLVRKLVGKRAGHNQGYHVQIGVNNDERRNGCDCPGHTYHGHCRHVSSLKQLLEDGDIR